MRRIAGITLVLILGASSLWAQVAPQATYTPEQMELVLKEASELQSTEPEAVVEKMAPVLNELRRLRDSGALKGNTLRIFREGLLLMMRTQMMLLAPEPDILAFTREILAVEPGIDEGLFNPREKLLLAKIRSTEAGGLTVETTPAGATLSYLGSDLGTTPGKFSLIAGNYKLQLRLPGYVDQEFDVAIQSSEIKTLSRTLRRRVMDVPVAINAPATTIRLGGRTLGISQGYKPWLDSLPSDLQTEYSSVVQEWKTDQAASSFFRLIDVPVGETFRIEFQAACHQPLVLEIKIADQDVDWARTLFVVPQLRHVQLTKDMGLLDIASTPSGADVWIDGTLLGQTPLEGKEICSGMHRIQIFHDSGQYVQEVSIQKGRSERIKGLLKPALAFLGIFEKDAKTGGYAYLPSESKSAARSIARDSRAFADPQLMVEDIESLQKKESLAIAGLLQDSVDAAQMSGHVRKLSEAAGRSELMLIGIRLDTGYLFRLYSSMHPFPDRIQIPVLDEAGLGFLISQTNKAENISERLHMPYLGVELADSTKGLIISKVVSSAKKSALVPGVAVKSIDEKPMQPAEFLRYLQSKKPEQTVVLEIEAAKDKVALVPVSVIQAGAEYPWNTPDGFPNSVLAMLKHMIGRDPLSDDGKLASLSLAKGLMKQKEWKLALEYLAKANFDLSKSGICPGTVLYYQARCYEEMGNRSQAESYYVRAKDYAEATLGTPYGLSVPVLAEQRLESLKKR